MRALLVSPARACSGAEVHSEEMKSSRDSSLTSGEPTVPREFWAGDSGGPHLFQGFPGPEEKLAAREMVDCPGFPEAGSPESQESPEDVWVRAG